MIYTTEEFKLEEPKDVRSLIKSWLADVCDSGALPFEGGGIVVQMLNVWLKSYEMEKMNEVEKRLLELEGRLDPQGR